MIATPTLDQLQVMDEIINQVNSYFEVDCMQNTRKRAIVYPRQIAMSIIYHLAPKTTITNIGVRFNVVHATVLNALKRVNNEIGIYQDSYAQYLDIIANIEKSEIYKNSNIQKNKIRQSLATEIYKKIISLDSEKLTEILKILH
tara:strand:+ start:1893 stop:2324 length:432 start_codon:yes stop_codon:yes gene_type:complete